MSAVWDQITELLDIWPGSRTLTFICLHPSTFRNFHSYRSSYCLQLSFVMYIMPDTLWSCQSVERDTPLTDRWMFLCFVVKTSVNYSGLITPRGRKRLTVSIRSSHSCNRNVPFLTCFSRIWWHHRASYPGGRQTPLETQRLLHRVFWSAKNAGNFCAKGIVMMHHALTHGTQWICWCM